MSRRTKIVATIGPASSSPEVLTQIISAGVDVCRLGLAHGSVEHYLETIKTIRRVSDELGKPVAILADLPGPKIRTTDMGEDGIVFANGSIVELKTGSEPTTAAMIQTDYPTVAEDLRPGDSVKLGDGTVDLLVGEVNGDVVKTTVSNGGKLRGKPGLHLPSDRVSIPVPTDEDRDLIKNVVLAGDVDFAAVSFVRNDAELNVVRDLLGDSGIKVVAKIETPTAMDNLEEIVFASDAVMVARGDLGTECPFEDVPVYQKRIIRTCLAASVPVITATQMLESMISASTPTRAEASDVANAVCDGTDAIMLSGETAIGHDPALVVRSMVRIAEAAEIVADYDRFAKLAGTERHMNEITIALTHGAWYALEDARVRAVLCCTRSGLTSHAMAAMRPDATLIALSTSEQTVRQEALTWGVVPLSITVTSDSDSMVAEAVRAAVAAGLVEAGDVVAVLSGTHDVPGATNDLRLVTVGG